MRLFGTRNTMSFSHTLPKSSNLLIGSFDIERARGGILLREFDLPLSTLEGCSPREGVFAILSIVIPSLAITASSKLCIVLNFSSKVFMFALISSSLALSVVVNFLVTNKPKETIREELKGDLYIV